MPGKSAREIIGYLDIQPAMPGLRFGKHGVDRVDRAGRHSDLCKRVEPPSGSMLPKCLFNKGKQSLTVRHPRPVGRKGRIIGDTFKPGDIAEFPETASHCRRQE